MEHETKEDLERALDINGLLIGIRFLHNFVRTEEGKREIERALDEGFVQTVPHTSGSMYAIPRFFWPDQVYDDLCPGKGIDVSIGIQIARYMLWGPPRFIATNGAKNSKWTLAICDAVRRFEAEVKQRSRQLSRAIQETAVKLAVRRRHRSGNDEVRVAISSADIFPLVRLKFPNVTQAEIDDAIMHNLPYRGGLRH